VIGPYLVVQLCDRSPVEVHPHAVYVEVGVLFPATTGPAAQETDIWNFLININVQVPNAFKLKAKAYLPHFKKKHPIIS
jgi:hypothetical protein